MNPHDAGGPDDPDSGGPDASDASDEILRCVIDGGRARAVAVVSTGVAREASARHHARGPVAIALARGVTSGLLLATLTKDDERVTLQVLGDGPLGGLTVDATAAGTARAFVKNPAVRLPPEPGEWLSDRGATATRMTLGRAIGGNGVVSVIRDLGLRETFNGQTSLVSGEIDEDVAHYLTASEQIASALRCEALLGPDGTVAVSAGILVQALPDTEGATAVDRARALLEDGALLRAIGEGGLAGARAAAGASADAAIGSAAEAVLRAALGPVLGGLQAIESRSVRFHCPCSRARAGASLALLGRDELAAAIAEDGKAEVICNFCRAQYDFTETDLEMIRREIERPN